MEVTDSYFYGGSNEYLHPWKQVNPKVGKNDFRNSEPKVSVLILSLIHQNGWIKILRKFVNLRVVNLNFRNPKVINRYLRNSNIIQMPVWPTSDYGRVTIFPFWESAMSTIWVFEVNLTISVQTDSVKVESAVRCGQRIPKLENVVTLWYNDCRQYEDLGGG